MIFTAEQEKQFFGACNEWQAPVFRTLATYGLRVGELTHLLVEDVDWVQEAFHVRSKPALMWNVKSRRHRTLPLTPEMRVLFEKLIGERKAGFVFRHEEFVRGTMSPPKSFSSDKAFRAQVAGLTRQLREADPETTDHERLRAVRRFCRSMGQIPEKRVRDEFMKLTKGIGCPEVTRVHDLRHLFSSRAQELGMNPLLVQELLGHATLEMTGRYTHLGLEAKRTALEQIAATDTNSPRERS